MVAVRVCVEDPGAAESRCDEVVSAGSGEAAADFPTLTAGDRDRYFSVAPISMSLAAPSAPSESFVQLVGGGGGTGMPPDDELEALVLEEGRALLERARRYEGEADHGWVDTIMTMAARDPEFRTKLLLLTDLLPALGDDSAAISDHIRQYFSDHRFFGSLAALADSLPGLRDLSAWLFRRGVDLMASRFLGGDDLASAAPRLQAMSEREHPIYATIAVLGEEVQSAEEAEAHTRHYEELIGELGAAHPGRKRTRGGKLVSEVSVKFSGLTQHFDAIDPEGTFDIVAANFRRVLRKAIAGGVHITVDLEQFARAELSYYIFMQVLSEPEFQDLRDVEIVLQSNLRDSGRYAQTLIDWVNRPRAEVDADGIPGRGSVPVHVRVVKGAYWDFETTTSTQQGWPIPVYLDKRATDVSFESNLRRLLERSPIRVSVGSHSPRSIAFALALKKRLGLPAGRLSFETLLGMEEDLLYALAEEEETRVYFGIGPKAVGMAYFVRRILENSSNVGMVQKRATGVDPNKLLQSPWRVDPTESPFDDRQVLAEDPYATGPFGPFLNEPLIDFSRAGARAAMNEALVRVGGEMGSSYPMRVNGESVSDGEWHTSINPATGEIVGRVPYAREATIDQAVSAARGARGWKDSTPRERAEILIRSAALLRERREEFSALLMLEVGKSRREADADVVEAIDFHEYYAREMMRMAINGDPLEAQGTVAVVPPWNFALAILAGMTSAALVTGNTVVLKPSERSPVIAARYVEVLEQAGLPRGVLNLVYGAGAEGAYLTGHPGVDMVAFTGSKGTGLRIYRAAAEATYDPRRRNIKKTVTEMGGDNGAIVDVDADMDDAVRYTGQSVFGYQKQKCSALSRILVHRSRYEEFVRRFKSYVQSLRIGNPVDPGIDLSALIDERALATVRDQQVGPARVRLQSTEFFEFEGPLPENGFYFRPTVVLDPPPGDPIVQQEAFAPVVSIIPYDTFDEAMDLFNGTEYGLTGGYIGRNPEHKARFVREARVGNLYINRKITGARVGIEWFGSDLGMSGVGKKSGGPHYLRQFMRPVAGSGPARPRRTYSSLEQVPERLRDRSGQLHRRMKKETGRSLNESLETVNAAQGKWGDRSLEGRATFLKKLANTLAGHREELVAILATEQGLSFTDANQQIERAVSEIWRVVEEAVKSLASHPTGILPGEETTAHYYPKGAGLLMTSPETTLPSLAAIMSASLVAGNTVVVSSIDDNPLLTFWMTEAVRAAGLPKNLILFQPNDPAEPTAMARHPSFSFVAHDGTAEQGARLLRETVTNLEVRRGRGVATFIGAPYDTLPTEPDFVHHFTSERVVSENQMRNGANLAQRPPILPTPIAYRSSAAPSSTVKASARGEGLVGERMAISGNPISSDPSDMVREPSRLGKEAAPEVFRLVGNRIPALVP